MDRLFQQLSDLATTDVNVVGMFALTVLIFALVALVIVWKSPEKELETSDNEVLRLLIEQFGSISTELRGFASAVKDNSIENTNEHREIVTTLKTMNTLMGQLVNGNTNVIQSVDILAGNIETYTDKITKTGDKIMKTVSPVEQALLDIKRELQDIRKSMDEYHHSITQKTIEIETRVVDVEQVLQKPEVSVPATRDEIKPHVTDLSKKEEEQQNESTTHSNDA